MLSQAQPIFRDPKRYPDMADPVLENKFSERGLNQAVAIASMCVQEEASARPLISDVMVALSFLSMPTEDGIPTTVPILSFKDKSMSIALSRHDSNLVSPPPELATEDDKSSTSSGEESSLESEKESVSKNEYKKKHVIFRKQDVRAYVLCKSSGPKVSAVYVRTETEYFISNNKELILMI